MKLTVAFLAPLDCGAKAICTRQVALIGTVPPATGHVVPDGAAAKLAASGPTSATWESVNEALPLFCKVMV
jgi:hypothetical protein